MPFFVFWRVISFSRPARSASMAVPEIEPLFSKIWQNTPTRVGCVFASNEETSSPSYAALSGSRAASVSTCQSSLLLQKLIQVLPTDPLGRVGFHNPSSTALTVVRALSSPPRLLGGVAHISLWG